MLELFYNYAKQTQVPPGGGVAVVQKFAYADYIEATLTVCGTITELPAPAPAPRVLSKLKLRDTLAAMGLWDALKAAIAADADVAERWALAQDVREDDPDFAALCDALTPQLSSAGIDLDTLLNQCIAEA